MAKQQIATDTLSVRTLGEWIGQAIGEGIAEGASRSVEESAPALQPLVDEIVQALRAQLQSQLVEAAAAAIAVHDSDEEVYETDSLEEIARAESTRPCIDDGCTEPAVSRNLCRRHYARKLYQERKERLGAHGFRVVQPRTTGSFGGEPVAQRKPLVAAVAPIIRRKRSDGIEAHTAVVAEPTPSLATPPSAPAFKMPGFEIAPNPIAAAAAKAGVTPESVARALGLMKE